MAVDLLTRIKTARATGFCRFHRLAIDLSGCRTRLVTSNFAGLHHQMMIDRLPPAVIPPLVEMALNCRERRKVLGPYTLLATALGNVEDRVHHSPKIRGARATATVFRW
jgi:hypothetical protein